MENGSGKKISGKNVLEITPNKKNYNDLISILKASPIKYKTPEKKKNEKDHLKNIVIFFVFSVVKKTRYFILLRVFNVLRNMPIKTSSEPVVKLSIRKNLNPKLLHITGYKDILHLVIKFRFKLSNYAFMSLRNYKKLDRVNTIIIRSTLQNIIKRTIKTVYHILLLQSTIEYKLNIIIEKKIKKKYRKAIKSLKTVMRKTFRHIASRLIPNSIKSIPFKFHFGLSAIEEIIKEFPIISRKRYAFILIKSIFDLNKQYIAQDS